MVIMKLKCAGAVSGTVEVAESSTVSDLLREVEKLAGMTEGQLKVIAGGKRLESLSGVLSLADVNITSATRLVATRSGSGGGVSTYDAHAGRMQRVERIQKAAEALASREAAGSRKFAFALETQAGDALQGGEGEGDGDGEEVFFSSPPTLFLARLCNCDCNEPMV